MSSPSPKPRVVVIGGGFAGIAAARRLHDNGADVIILEARDRLGGRVWTDNSFGCGVDLGASWLHGPTGHALAPTIAVEGMPLYSTTDTDSCLLDHDLKSLALYDTDGSDIPIAVAEEVAESFESILSDVWDEAASNRAGEDEPLSAAMGRVMEAYGGKSSIPLDGSTLPSRVLQWYISSWDCWFATSMSSVSCRWATREYEITGGHSMLPLGHGPVAVAMARGIPHRLCAPVVRVERRAGRGWEEKDGEESVGSHAVVVTTARGEVFPCDGVVCALPLGVLQACHQSMFVPALPHAKASALASCGVGYENKIALLFPRVFWPEVDFFGMVARRPGDCSYFQCMTPMHGKPVLVYMTCGPEAEECEKLTDEQSVAFAMRLLRDIFDKRGVTVPEPIGFKITRWGSDPYSRGGYSYMPVGFTEEEFHELCRPLGPLVFAGEHVNNTHKGTTHGAVLTGVNAAGVLMERLKLGRAAKKNYVPAHSAQANSRNSGSAAPSKL